MQKNALNTNNSCHEATARLLLHEATKANSHMRQTF